MIYRDDEVAIKNLIRSVVQDEEEYRMAYPKVFDCPICKHQTLSDSRFIKDDRGEKKPTRYCFGCGNIFFKRVSWEGIEVKYKKEVENG